MGIMELTAVSSILTRAGYEVPKSSGASVTLPVTSGESAETTKASSFLNADTLALTGRLAGHAAGSGFATYRYGAQIGTQMKEVYLGLKNGGPAGTESALINAKGLAMSSIRGAGLAGLISAGTSAIANGLGVVKGKTDSQTAISNVLSDTMTGTIGGLGAVTIGGAGNLALASFGVVGLPLTIATVALGAAGGTLMGHLLHKGRNPETNPETATPSLKTEGNSPS
jgi:hypothetical protein